MTDREALIRAILAQPAEDTPRLAFADWLEENGEDERAEFIRVQVELARIPDMFKCNEPEKCYYANACENGCGKKQSDELRSREWELFKDSGYKWWNDVPGQWRRTTDDMTIESASGIDYRVSRGFVSHITCSWSDWLAHADAIIACQPVERVKLRTWPEAGLDYRWWTKSVCGGRFGAVIAGCNQLGYGDSVNKALVAAMNQVWPRIAFELPPDNGLRHIGTFSGRDVYAGVSLGTPYRDLRAAENL